MNLTSADLAIARGAQAMLARGDAGAAQTALMRVSPPAMSHPDILFVASGILRAQGRLAEARRALEGAAHQAPGNVQLWLALADLLDEAGDGEASIATFRRTLALAPGDQAARHNLANALRRAGRLDEGLAEIDALGGSPECRPETLALRGHLLGDTGRLEEAAEQYRQALHRAPGLIEAHETLARLLPQIGRPDEALDSYKTAIAAQPEDRTLLESAVVAARDVKDSQRLIAWAAEAQRRFGADPHYALAGAIGREMAGERGEAISELRRLAAEHPDFVGAHNHLAPLLLAEGEVREAERHALRATQLAPLDQSGWAWLSVAWRLLNDPREAWLADYDRLVIPIALDGPLDVLRVSLEAMHVADFHPAEQSLRNGTQTRGNLFERRDPAVQELARSIKSQVEERLATLPLDPGHPFLSRLDSQIAFAGSWSVRLKSEGFHINHIHQSGWLSSACYIALPPEMSGDGDEGALAFGCPDSTLGLDLPPRRIVRPQKGQLVIFPSYFWHGTIPFESEHPRLTVAFDALPSAG